MIRTPAAGPEPANTLVYLTGEVDGYALAGRPGKWERGALQFRTEFRIDGFLQSQHEWYLQNTLVSATGMLRFLNTTTDMLFGAGLDRVTHFIDPDGTLGFIYEHALLSDPDFAPFGPGAEITCDFSLSAWVLVYEPVQPRLPSSSKQHSAVASLASSLLSDDGRSYLGARSRLRARTGTISKSGDC